MKTDNAEDERRVLLKDAGDLLHQQSRMAKQTAYGTTGEEDLEFVEPKAVARDALQVISGLVLARGLGQSQDRNFELTA